jgi:MSHA biogenesis protein MshL
LSTVRETDSIVRAKSGQVVVIGGLMQDLIKEQDAKTPFFGDVPVVGNLFKHKKYEAQKSELVILLRPVIVASNDDWQQDMQKSVQELGELRQKREKR